MNENQNALVKSNPPSETLSVFGNLNHFESAQRMAKALCTSPMVPESYRGEQNIGSCLIALEMANRIGANVLSVCQNLYIVHGKPAWSSQFLIACVNASGKFTPLRYTATGEKGTDSQGCIAWASDKSGERLESPEITIGMAKAEGWYQKNGSKWKTLPELMLRYRAATLFARLYAPEITLGIHTDDEVIDVVEVAPVVTSPTFVPKNETPKPVKTTKTKAAPVQEVVVEVVSPTATQTTPPNPETTTSVEELGQPAAQAATASEPTFESIVDSDKPEIAALREAMKAQGIEESKVLLFCNSRGLLKEGGMKTGTLDDIRSDKLVPLTKNIMAAGETMKKIKESV